jgi:hypothetical protein
MDECFACSCKCFGGVETEGHEIKPPPAEHEAEHKKNETHREETLAIFMARIVAQLSAFLLHDPISFFWRLRQSADHSAELPAKSKGARKVAVRHAGIPTSPPEEGTRKAKVTNLLLDRIRPSARSVGRRSWSPQAHLAMLGTAKLSVRQL